LKVEKLEGLSAIGRSLPAKDWQAGASGGKVRKLKLMQISLPCGKRVRLALSGAKG